jgi:polyisoprenoid-binding protein YceI
VTRTRLTILAIIALSAIGIGGFYAYDQVLRGDSVAALILPASTPAGPAASPASPAASDGGATVSLAPGASSDPISAADVAGTWNVASGSQAGYRVRERLANLPAESDAVGRTSDVTGSVTLEANGDGATLTSGTLTVDTQTIASDKQMRDNRLRSEGLQTDQYPTAMFELTQPVDIPASALSGTPANVTLTGDLTLHGVTKSVQIPAQAQLAGGQIQVAGSLGFPLTDYQISAPNVGGFVLSISDQGTLEFLVAFSKG